jgi:hypothetical protein
LADSRSSHSFISEQVAASVSGVTQSPSQIEVKVANGNILQSQIELLQAKWSIQWFSFTSDVKAMDMHNFDMIIGMDWLERFSPMKIHWAQKWLSIPYGKGHITLQGILLGYIDCCLIEIMQMSAESQDQFVSAIPLSIQYILD